MVSQLRHFVFTYHLKEDDIDVVIRDRIRGKLDSWGGVRYMCIGSELGASGKRPHLQGYVQLSKRKSFKIVGSAFPWHIENAQGSAEENRTYCSKEEHFFWEYGKLKEVTKKSVDMAVICEMSRQGQMAEIESKYPATYLRHRSTLLAMALEVENPCSYERKAIWLVGAPGSGKTRFANALNNDVYFKNPNRWFDGYHDNEIICIDDVDATNFGKLAYWLKRWGDRYPVLGERKHGSLYLKHKACVVTSNFRIETLCEKCYVSTDTKLALQRRYKEVIVFGHRETPSGEIEVKTHALKDEWLNKDNIFS
jgi:hypothetical protein